MGMSVEHQTDAMRFSVPGARRGSIQATEPIFQAGGLTSDRDAPMRIRLLTPTQPRDLATMISGGACSGSKLAAQPHRGTVRDGLLSHLRRVCS